MPGAMLNSFEDREIKVTGLLSELADLYQTRLQNIPEEMLGVDFVETRSGMPTLTALLEIYFRLQDFPKLDSVFRQICRYGARAGFALDRFDADNSAVGLTEEEARQTLDNMKQLSQDAILWVFMGDFCRDAYRIDFKRGAYVTMDDMGDAEGFYKRAIELDDKEPITYAALGDLYFSQKKYQDAAKAYERASELAPEQPYFVAQLAHSYSGMGKHESAIQIAQKLTERMPNDKDAHRVLGVVYFNASRYEEAIEQFQLGLDNEYMERATRTPMIPEKVIVYLLARAYDHIGRHEELKAIMEKMAA
jgi:tetratricopeptide (TPR) repeat protein